MISIDIPFECDGVLVAAFVLLLNLSDRSRADVGCSTLGDSFVVSASGVDEERALLLVLLLCGVYALCNCSWMLLS